MAQDNGTWKHFFPNANNNVGLSLSRDDTMNCFEFFGGVGGKQFEQVQYLNDDDFFFVEDLHHLRM